MTVLASAGGLERAETPWWTMCFVAVVAAHGLVAFWLLPSHQDASEFDAGAPVSAGKMTQDDDRRALALDFAILAAVVGLLVLNDQAPLRRLTRTALAPSGGAH